MTEDRIPPMEALAPIVDQMRELAREELPTPRACRIELWDDGTFDIVIYHSMGPKERQQLRYERTTSEILWEHISGADWNCESTARNETVHEPVYDDLDVRVITTVEPPTIHG